MERRPEARGSWTLIGATLSTRRAPPLPRHGAAAYLALRWPGPTRHARPDARDAEHEPRTGPAPSYAERPTAIEDAGSGP